MAALFILAFLCVLAMPKIVTKTEKLRTEKTLFGNILRLYRLVGSEFKICIDIIRKKSEVLSSFVFLALSQVIILVLATIIPDYTQKTLGIGAEDISLVIFAPAALGMILSSLLIGSKFAKIKKEVIINAGIFLSVLILILFASVDLQKYFNVLYATILVAFTAGVANACIFIPTQTIVQTSVEEKYLSKIYGLLFAVVGVMAFLPIILAGVFADVLGVRAVLIGIALLLLSIGFLKIFLEKRRHS
jgi:MFS family permease